MTKINAPQISRVMSAFGRSTAKNSRRRYAFIPPSRSHIDGRPR